MTALVERAVPTPGPGPGFTAMVVDDHPLVRESMVARLMAMGARDVVEAACIAEARARAHAGGPRDLCVLDVGLPDGSGLDLLADLRASGWPRLVEMIEAVGEKWWPTYFAQLDALLAAGGSVGLQSILMPHDRLLASKSSWTWIHKYIFPGGLIPSERAIDDVLHRHTTLRVADRLRFGTSYARTLHAWRENFTRRAREVDALGFDPTFRRMWTFYLAYCEAGFRAGYLDVAQLVLNRSGAAR